jgi:hypothetical protein
MFRTIAVIGVVVAIVGFVVSAARRRAVTAADGGVACPCLGWVEKGIYLIMFFGLLVAMVTGLGSAVARGHMSGWALMIHVGLAPAFMLGMAGVAVTMADRCRFVGDRPGSTFGAWENFLFWVMLVATLIAILSAVLPMTPVFGTYGQHVSLDVHRYSSLVAAVAVILHAGKLLSYRGAGARKVA